MASASAFARAWSTNTRPTLVRPRAKRDTGRRLSFQSPDTAPPKPPDLPSTTTTTTTSFPSSAKPPTAARPPQSTHPSSTVTFLDDAPDTPPEPANPEAFFRTVSSARADSRLRADEPRRLSRRIPTSDLRDIPFMSFSLGDTAGGLRETRSVHVDARTLSRDFDDAAAPPSPPASYTPAQPHHYDHHQRTPEPRALHKLQSRLRRFSLRRDSVASAGGGDRRGRSGRVLDRDPAAAAASSSFARTRGGKRSMSAWLPRSLAEEEDDEGGRVGDEGRRGWRRRRSRGAGFLWWRRDARGAPVGEAAVEEIGGREEPVVAEEEREEGRGEDRGPQVEESLVVRDEARFGDPRGVGSREQDSPVTQEDPEDSSDAESVVKEYEEGDEVFDPMVDALALAMEEPEPVSLERSLVFKPFNGRGSLSHSVLVTTSDSMDEMKHKLSTISSITGSVDSFAGSLWKDA